MILRSINSSTDLISFLLIKIQSSFLLDKLFFSVSENFGTVARTPSPPWPLQGHIILGAKNAPKKGAPRRAQEGPGRGLFRALKIPENPGNFRPQKPRFWSPPGAPFRAPGRGSKNLLRVWKNSRGGFP